MSGSRDFPRVSFRLRLTLFGAGLVAMTVVAFGWLVYTLAANSQATTQDDVLKQRAADAVGSIATTAPGELNGSTPLNLSAAEDLHVRTDPFVEVLSPGGVVLSSTARIGSLAPSAPSSFLDEARRTGTAMGTVDMAAGSPVRLYAKRWDRPDLGLYGFVLAGQPISVQSTNRKGLLGFLIISSIPTLLAALIAGWLITGRALRPLKTVAETAESIASTRDLKRRLPPGNRRDEISLLSRSFNRMLEQLETAYEKLSAALEAQRRFVADASHELRTPLTTIRGNADLLAHGPSLSDDVRSAAARDIASESERMSRMVEQLLTLAQADAGQHLELAPVQLRPLIESVCRQAQAAHADRRLRSVGLTDATVEGDQDALTQLLWILVDNAVKFTQPNGCIEVGLQQHDSTALLTVADDGAGIPPADLERIFERFYQAESARTNKGGGLGLSIARWIVEQHHGTIRARNNDGPGATFTVTLPLAGA
ncbi:MAG TPA: HAMP domain-containing sensor histidine kinase [Candidatus Acidoferrum sp.]|nr:HAMP domain-containing sensor histidine kinase [Candidatus Acidoferrum sp.]